MNRILIVLVVIQTVLIGAFVFRFGTLEAQTDRIEKAVALQMSAGGATAPVRAPASTSARQSALSPEEYEALRVIIREEIDRLAEEIDAGQGPRTAAESPRADETAQAPSVSPAESVRLLEEFENELASHRAKGVLSPSEMARLEQRIARMPPAARARALSQLSKAISEGSIDAKL